MGYVMWHRTLFMMFVTFFGSCFFEPPVAELLAVFCWKITSPPSSASSSWEVFSSEKGSAWVVEEAAPASEELAW